MKLLEWNIHKMTNKIPVKDFVCKRILELDNKADIICLVEYIDDNKIRNRLKDEYWINESISESGNKILIAISKLISSKKPQVVRETEETGCYNFLHVKCVIDELEKELSIIGIRMLSPMDASKQTPPLNKYLKTIEGSFVCVGDFNIKEYRMGHWFDLTNYKIETLQKSNDKIENFSYIYIDKQSKIVSSYGAVDHVLGSSDLEISSKYKWDFLSDDDIYPQKDDIKINRTVWDIKPAYPDHAIMITDIRFD